MNKPTDDYPDGSLEGLFLVLDGACRSGIMPGPLHAPPPVDDAMMPDGTPPPGNDTVAPDGTPPPGGIADGAVQAELFADPGPRPARDGEGRTWRRGCPAGLRSFPPEGSAALFPDLRKSVSAALLYELSADAFDGVVFAWMSELPIEGEMLRFGWKVLAAAGAVPAAAAPVPNGAGSPAADVSGPLAEAALRAARPDARREAERAAFDRGDPDVRTVLEAAFKVVHETDRLKGLLRFAPSGGGDNGCFGGGERDGLYLARCFPDHHVLPALAEHFTRRFGARGWAIVDERRGLALLRRPGGDAKIVPAAIFGPPDPPVDGYEDLWRHYHRTINNESRNNPALQRRFMPKRYWKYLPELR
jgi:probable DNA metabolism protein